MARDRARGGRAPLRVNLQPGWEYLQVPWPGPMQRTFPADGEPLSYNRCRLVAESLGCKLSVRDRTVHAEGLQRTHWGWPEPQWQSWSEQDQQWSSEWWQSPEWQSSSESWSSSQWWQSPEWQSSSESWSSSQWWQSPEWQSQSSFQPWSSNKWQQSQTRIRSAVLSLYGPEGMTGLVLRETALEALRLKMGPEAVQEVLSKESVVIGKDRTESFATQDLFFRSLPKLHQARASEDTSRQKQEAPEAQQQQQQNKSTNKQSPTWQEKAQAEAKEAAAPDKGMAKPPLQEVAEPLTGGGTPLQEVAKVHPATPPPAKAPPAKAPPAKAPPAKAPPAVLHPSSIVAPTPSRVTQGHHWLQRLFVAARVSIKVLPERVKIEDYSSINMEKHTARATAAIAAATEAMQRLTVLSQTTDVLEQLLSCPVDRPAAMLCTTCLGRADQLQVALPLNLLAVLTQTVNEIQAFKRQDIQGARVCVLTMGADLPVQTWLSHNPTAAAAKEAGLLVAASAGHTAANGHGVVTVAEPRPHTSFATEQPAQAAPQAAAARPGYAGTPLPRESVVEHWHASLAKNTAHCLALASWGAQSGEALDSLQDLCCILINADCDNVVGQGFVARTWGALYTWFGPGSRGSHQPGLTSLPKWAHSWVQAGLPGHCGRITCTAAAFKALLGYDEDIKPSGAQDVDLRERLRLAAKWWQSHTGQAPEFTVPSEEAGLTLPQNQKALREDRGEAKVAFVDKVRFPEEWGAMNKDNLSRLAARRKDTKLVRNNKDTWVFWPDRAACTHWTQLGYSFRVIDAVLQGTSAAASSSSGA